MQLMECDHSDMNYWSINTLTCAECQYLTCMWYCWVCLMADEHCHGVPGAIWYRKRTQFSQYLEWFELV